MKKSLIITVTTCALLSLGACGSGDAKDGESTNDSAGASTTKSPAASATFCEKFEDNGGDARTVGPIAAYELKETLLKKIDEKLKAMGDLKPPEEIATHWDAAKTYYHKLRDVTAKLSEGGQLGNPKYLREGNELFSNENNEAFTGYYFDHCQP